MSEGPVVVQTNVHDVSIAMVKAETEKLKIDSERKHPAYCLINAMIVAATASWLGYVALSFINLALKKL